MKRLFGAAYVIARRDYVATVWSKTFLIFLLAPILPALMGMVMAALGGGDDRGGHGRDSIAIVADAGTARALVTARAELAARLGRGALPALDSGRPALPGQPRIAGTLDAPRLAAPPALLRDLAGPIALIVDRARADRALGPRAPAPVALATIALHGDAGDSGGTAGDPIDVARGGQLLLFFLTILLAGMMVSNMAEEKSNKVIELLVAAVPVDAIFFGKLLAILGASLTGLAVWSMIGVAALPWLIPAGGLPVPALGWPAFVALALGYFVTIFLLWGALYLGIGAQAGSAREAQTMSMPLTLGEAFAYVLASAAAAHPDRPIGLVAAIVPWSSPFAMIGRAATEPGLWPHALALAWQIFAIALTIGVGARLFRTNILKSGRPARPGRGGRTSRARMTE